MKILVTGASGFLGGHLVDAALRQGHQVRALVRETSELSRLCALPGLELAYGDLGDAASLRRAVEGVDVVQHSAARVVEHGTRAQFWNSNVTGTRLLLDAARDAGAGRFVFISSPSALMRVGDGDRYGIDESAPYPTRFHNLYSETKAAAERLVLAADQREFTTVALRPRGVWGPRDHAGFLPRVIARMAAGRFPDLLGGRRVLASLCHCDNAVAATLLASTAPAERIAGKAYFVADKDPADVREFLERVAGLFGVPPPTRRIPPLVRDALVEAVELVWKLPLLAARERPLSRYSVALLTRSTTYDIGAAERDLGYVPVTGQETGLRGFETWVRSLGGLEVFLRTVR